MRLVYTPTSPFARKVRIFAQEKGVKLEMVMKHPLLGSAEVLREIQALNPLGEVPVLLANGLVLPDSRVICEYLEQFPGPTLVPASGPARWRAKRLEALADGGMDSAAAVVLERRLPQSQRSGWIEDHLEAILRAVRWLDEQPMTGFGLGEISVASFLGYLDFRHAALGWKTLVPRLARWYAEIEKRPSVAESVPPRDA